MRHQHTIFRLTAMIAIGGLVFGELPIPIAHAQPAPPPGAAPAADDPPARVGRLSRIDGTVSFHTADETQWGAATLNYPVTSGNSFWTEPKAGADIEVSGSRLTLADQTEFDIATLDDHAMTATESQGEMFLRLRDLKQGDTFSITTPRATVTLSAVGQYDIVAGDTDHPTLVTVIEGSAQIAGTNISLQVGARQTATVSGTDNFQANVAAAGAPDAFLRTQIARYQAPPPVQPSRALAPPIVAAMTGGDELEEVGEWVEAPQYGRVWYPPVQRDWVPYRDGHWAWVAPWGWTWVDEASWGFAPSHYGRWVEINDRWGWTPVSAPPPGEPVPVYGEPVYAPAMVTFVDLAAGAAVGVAAGVALGAAVGWIPLGPREPYIPPYRTSERYLQQVNVTNVTNITTINNIRNNPPGVERFANQRGATFVPGAAMAGSQPIAQRVERVTPQAVAAGRPISRIPVTPTLATAGVTPSVARQFNLQQQAGVAARPVAPGPAVQARPADFGRGPLRPVNAPGGSLAASPAGPTAPSTGALPGAAPVEPGRPGIGPGGAAIGGAVIGGAVVGGAVVGGALLNRPRPVPGGPVTPLPGARPGMPPQLAPAQAPGTPAPGAAPAGGPGRPPVAPPGGRPAQPGAVTPSRSGQPGVITPPLNPAPAGRIAPPALQARPGPAPGVIAPPPASGPATPRPTVPTRPVSPAAAAAPPVRPVPSPATIAPPARPAPSAAAPVSPRPAAPVAVAPPRPTPAPAAPPPARPAPTAAPPSRPTPAPAAARPAPPPHPGQKDPRQP